MDGRERPPLFPPINPLAVAAGELEVALLGPLPEEEEAIPRTEVDVPHAPSRDGPGTAVKDGGATPRIARECP